MLILIPGIFLAVLLAWMLLVAKGTNSTSISLSGFGINLALKASKDRNEQIADH